MADLTRFDFNAHNFLNSETVEVMSDAEIGQYIMLLAKAWTLAKATSLPDEPELLAKWAHCKRVSDRVLAKFPVVDTEFGPRRRNNVLFLEWMRTLERHETAVELGRKGGMSISVSKIQAARENGHFGGRPRNPSETQAETEAHTIPYQSVPIQTIPNQYAVGNFSTFAVRYRRVFGAKIGRGKKAQERYAQACRQFSEDAVLKAFDGWADNNLWIKEKFETGQMYSDGLKAFYDSLSDLVAEELAFQQDEAATQGIQENQELILARSVEAGHAQFLEREKTVVEELEEQDATIKRISDNPSAFFGQTEG